jgi:hypothetical protein
MLYEEALLHDEKVVKDTVIEVDVFEDYDIRQEDFDVTAVENAR